MEIEILEDTKRHLVFNLKGVDHTLSNLLVSELKKDANILVASYAVEHPLKGIPKFIVDTGTKSTPRDAVVKAIKTIKKSNDNLTKNITKAFK